MKQPCFTAQPGIIGSYETLASSALAGALNMASCCTKFGGDGRLPELLSTCYSWKLWFLLEKGPNGGVHDATTSDWWWIACWIGCFPHRISHISHQTCQVFTEPLWRASVVAQARKIWRRLKLLEPVFLAPTSTILLLRKHGQVHVQWFLARWALSGPLTKTISGFSVFATWISHEICGSSHEFCLFLHPKRLEGQPQKFSESPTLEGWCLTKRKTAQCRQGNARL